jgi:hypothetical protein
MLTHLIVRTATIVFLLIAAPVLMLYRHQLELLDLMLLCLAVLAGLGTWMLSLEE